VRASDPSAPHLLKSSCALNQIRSGCRATIPKSAGLVDGEVFPHLNMQRGLSITLDASFSSD
jgi:hypothetical protein